VYTSPTSHSGPKYTLEGRAGEVQKHCLPFQRWAYGSTNTLSVGCQNSSSYEDRPTSRRQFANKSTGTSIPGFTACVIELFRIRKCATQKGKAIRVTGGGGPQGCVASRLPHFLDNRLTDDGEVVSLKRRPPFTPRRIPSTHFC
jgi:hypothetical protein